MGHIGKDPEIRTAAGGALIANLTLATNDRRKGPDGTYTDVSEWHALIAFSRIAELCRDYVKKGSQVFIEGKLQTRSWDDKESGQKKYKTEILVNELTLIGGKGKQEDVEANIHGQHITDSDVPF
jgi:single-strand DNA-binding protein